MDQAQRQATQAQIDQWAADCFATIPQGASDYDKALGVFTIIQHADYQVVDNNSIVNIMVGGAGLCGCYAKTTQYLLGLLGVDTAYITGQAQGESHAWNLAWLDGTPCWIDTTWGDPVFTGGDDSQGPAYRYFSLAPTTCCAPTPSTTRSPSQTAPPTATTTSSATASTSPPMTPTP